MKIKLMLALLTFSTSAPAIDCGLYQVNGIARSTKNGLIIVVNEKTQSEITITVINRNWKTMKWWKAIS